MSQRLTRGSVASVSRGVDCTGLAATEDGVQANESELVSSHQKGFRRRRTQKGRGQKRQRAQEAKSRRENRQKS